MVPQNIAASPAQYATAPGRIFTLKLRGDDTHGSLMMFEETVPVGTKSTSTCITTATRWPMC